MMIASLTFILGILIGIGATSFLGRGSKALDEQTAEAIAAKIALRQTDQILRLAEEKLGDKKEAIDGTLKMMKADMKSDLTRVEEAMKAIGTSTTKVDTRLENAARTIQDLTQTTNSLKNALSSNAGRGQWGERMAEDVLRMAGFVEGVNYTRQKKLESSGSRPDFTFLLPQNLKLNMDVKFPFNNYQAYVNATTDLERKDAKEKFLKDVKQRVKEIQTRDYINPADATMDYVLLFVPNEQVFAFINEHDRELIDEAMRAKTILCSPLSLYAVLAVIRQAMMNFTLEQKSREMLSLFGTFKLQWEKFREQVDSVKKKFEQVSTSFEELTGTRQRQLEKPLQKIEELRMDQKIAPALDQVLEQEQRMIDV